MTKKTKRYVLIAFSWSWLGWIIAYLMSNLQGTSLVMDSTLFSLWSETWASNQRIPQLLFALAVYGPLIGYLVTRKADNVSSSVKLSVGSTSENEDSNKLWYLTLLVPIVSSLPVIIISLLASHNIANTTFTTLLISVGLYFISNFVTSGTEEFGWRGVVYTEMRSQGLSFWDIAWRGGLIWAFWHYPIMIIMYLPLGAAVLLPSLIGFTASIVAMNYITNFIYEKTHNIWFAVLLHALNNTMSFLVILLFPKTPFTILTSLMSWVFVAWIDKRYKKHIY